MLIGQKVKGEFDAIFRHSGETSLSLPLGGPLIHAGAFSGLAEDWIEEEIDFNQHFILNPTCTFWGRITSDSMEPEIHEGSFVLYDSSFEYTHGTRIVGVLNGEYVAKVLWRGQNGFELRSYNQKYKPIPINEENVFEIKGKITVVIRPYICA